MRITITITPVAPTDPPLLNPAGGHGPFALRASADAVQGADAYDIRDIYRRVQPVAAKPWRGSQAPRHYLSRVAVNG